jgi:2-enoate reductase
MVATSRTVLLSHIERLGVAVLTSYRCVEIRRASVVIEAADGARTERPADTVLIAVGDRPNRTLASQLGGRVAEIHEVGDGREPASVIEAVSAGYAVGKAL